MNVFVADPHWGWWIVGYFYLGGIASGAYFLAALIDFAGRAEDRPLADLGYRLAFPLIAVCGVFLILDLDRPERFWHMVFQSERVAEAFDAGWPLGGWGAMADAVMLKPWSPMSIGAWAVMLFGLFGFVSLLSTFRPEGWLSRRLRRGWVGRVAAVLGSFVGFFVASYTGVLLTATNQPVWSASEWVGALFLTSAASTGMAAVLLLGRWRRVAHDSLERLERADLFALGLELVVFALFLVSLGGALALLWHTWPGKLFVLGTLSLGLAVPLAAQLRLLGRGTGRMAGAAACALVGGFVLRYGIVMTPPAVLADPPAWARDAEGEGTPPRPFGIAISPEDGRGRGGGVGASGLNRPAKLVAPLKLEGRAP